VLKLHYVASVVRTNAMTHKVDDYWLLNVRGAHRVNAAKPTSEGFAWHPQSDRQEINFAERAYQCQQ